MEEGDIASFPVEVLGLASGETVSRSTTGLKKGQQQSGVFVGKNGFFCTFFSERARSIPQGVSVKKIAQLFEDLTA